MNTLTLSRFNPVTLSQTHKWMLLASVCIFALALLSIGYGPAGWDWRLAIAWLAPERFNQFDALQINVVMQIRLPRFLLAVLVGLVLAQTGASVVFTLCLFFRGAWCYLAGIFYCQAARAN